MNEHLFDKIAVTVAIAMQHASNNERHNGNVVEKVTRDIMSAVKEELPPLIDLEEKWELKGDEGIHVNLIGRYNQDDRQIKYLSRFSTDQGYNIAIIKMMNALTVPLKQPKKRVIVE